MYKYKGLCSFIVQIILIIIVIKNNNNEVYP